MTDANESDEDALARRLEELLGELRLILPGVTVLFAFLLTLPFTAAFASVAAIDRVAYFVAFLGAALAMILLIAQSAYHRLRGRPYDKALMVRTASRQAIAAIALLAVSMTSAVFLVTDVVFGDAVAAPLAAGVLAFILATWFVLPLLRRVRRDR